MSIRSTKSCVSRLLACLVLFAGLGSPGVASATYTSGPYPKSSVITGITFDTSSLVRKAPGSDLWPVAWADDDNLYTAWGDGGGFGGTNSDGRVSLGVARLAGSPPAFTGINVFGGKSASAPATFTGKPTGVLAVGSTLYMLVIRDTTFDRGKMCRSTDAARSWTCTNWDFEPPLDGISFLTIGKGHAGSDGYVYGYNSDGNGVMLARVPVAQIMSRAAYQFFAGTDAAGAPVWSSDITRRRPVFSDPQGTGWAPRAAYHPVLRRYLLAVHHNEAGGWGLFDAPTPWGPWTTVVYHERWLDDGVFKFGFTFNQKWMNGDGRTLYMIFSGTGVYDSFNVIKATLTVASATTGGGTGSGGTSGGTPSAPSSPTGVTAGAQGSATILLRWTDPGNETEYRVERQTGSTGPFQQVAVLPANTTSYTAPGLPASAAYGFRVRACNAAGCSGYSVTALATTPSSGGTGGSSGGTGSTGGTGGGSTPGTSGIPANTWVAMNAPRGPGGRGWIQVSFDTVSREVILFGGSGETYQSDTWAYKMEINTWQLLRDHPDKSGPCRRDNLNLVYDAAGRKHWLFNGIAYDNLQPGCAGPETRNGTWTYDRVTNAWTRVTAAGEKTATRTAPALAYNPDDGSVLQFGGVSVNTTNDTLRFAIGSRAWTRLAPAGAVPPARTNVEGALVYDRASKVFVLFGGSGPKNDTWLFDPRTTTWRNVTPAVSPPARELHAMAYDEANRVVILTGGRGKDAAGNSVIYDDTWAYSTATNTWKKLTVSGLPKLYHHSAVYNPAQQAVMLISGLGNGDVRVLRYQPTGSTTPPPPVADTTPPTVKITAPLAGATVSGSVALTATAGDNIAVASVTFKTGSTQIGSAKTAAPYSVTWDTTATANGAKVVTATAQDAAGNVATARINVTVQNSATPPAGGGSSGGSSGGTGGSSGGSSGGTPPPVTGTLSIPVNTWIARLYPPHDGVSAPGRNSKDIRFALNPDDSRIYISTGDWSGPFYSDSGRQETFSYDVVTDRWAVEHPSCAASGVQPMRPDEIGFTYDTKRKLFWLVPGFELNLPDTCHTGVSLMRGSVMTFDPATRAWVDPRRAGIPSAAPGIHTYAEYDPVTDALIVLGQDEVLHYAIQTNQWQRVPVRTPNIGTLRLSESRATIDVTGRAVYSIDNTAKRLLRYRIDAQALDDLGPLPAATHASVERATNVGWDPINHVLLWWHYDEQRVRVYHPDTKQWELPSQPNPSGQPLRGNSAYFDPMHNVFIVMGASETCNVCDYFFLYRYGTGR